MPKVKITSAISLSSTQLKTITDALSQKYQKIEIEQTVDPEIIGGLKITVGSKQIDASVRGKIEQLKQALQ